MTTQKNPLSIALAFGVAVVITTATARSQIEVPSARVGITAEIRGRCVDAATGEPLAGCVVQVRCDGGGPPDPKISEAIRRPAPTKTAADGSFSIRIVAHKNYHAGVRISRDGYWPRTGKWWHVSPGSSDDLGRIEFHRGVYAVGTVVDTLGHPVVHAVVRIDHLPLPLDVSPADKTKRSGGLHHLADRQSRASTGADGTFRSRDALPSGTFKLRVSGRSLRLVRPRTITIPAKGPMKPLTIVVEEGASISGRVVDDAGQPVEGVVLMARHVGSTGFSSMGFSQADGSFRISRTRRFPGDFRIEVRDGARCEPGEPILGLEWNTTGHLIELRRLPSVELTVVDAGTGKPIERFAVVCVDAGGWRNHKRRLRQSGRHLGGELTVQGVPRGRGKLIIVPTEDWFLPIDVDVVGRDNMKPIRVRLCRLAPMKILVRDAKGVLRRDVQVRVILPGNIRAFKTMEYDPRSRGSAWISDSSASFDTVLSKTTTDANGQGILYGIAGRHDLILSIGTRRNPTTRIEGVSFGGGHLSRSLTLDEK
jgi:hypothetical protein